MPSSICAHAPFQASLVFAAVVALGSPTSVVSASSADPDSTAANAASRDRIQTVVDDLKARLDLDHDVIVTLVDDNPKVVSVERDRDRFALSFQSDFLETLSEEELEAVVAHELGHVWIFTHHPYLHTEALANQIAMRVVSRKSLDAVYKKVWARGGPKGDLVRFVSK